MTQYAYSFQEAAQLEPALHKELLGGKGAGLAEMTCLGLPVPPGFTLTTGACLDFLERSTPEHSTLPDGLWEGVLSQLAALERVSGKSFGHGPNPLLLSVRSGAKFSMPGMMDTLLNLGLNDGTVGVLAQASGDPRFALDSYRRFIALYGDIVLGVPRHHFDALLEGVKRARGVHGDLELNEGDLEKVVSHYQALVLEHTGQAFPQDPHRQLEGAIKAVFASWNTRRAVTYRQLNHIPHHLGTAVTVQCMVFGNLGPDSGTGVGFTRDPNTGGAELFGEFLFQAQGEDVVAGIRTPETLEGHKERLPVVHRQLVKTVRLLERHYGDMQDFEFTVENAQLFLLQTRSGKRTAGAAVKVAVDLALEGLITRAEAVMRVPPAALEQVLHPRLKAGHTAKLLTRGLPASPGAVSGAVVFSVEAALERSKYQNVLLVTAETSPEDIAGMNASVGILTARGGMTSHAAVVARGMGKPAVVGAESLTVNAREGWLEVGGVRILEGEILTLEGASGHIFVGEVPTEPSQAGPELETLLGWADTHRRLKVRANADTVEDALRARAFGADGIGLCRTEHMFFGDERLPWVREFILAETETQERDSLEKLLEMQKVDFYGILKAMDGLPVTVRLLDPPLHEFLPALETLAVECALLDSSGQSDPKKLALLARVRQLHEHNPMMGLRGVRLLLTRPALLEMQVRALAEAACQLKLEGLNPQPEIMIPLVGFESELKAARAQVKAALEKVFLERGRAIQIPIGTMIEVPRACLVAADLAQHADFFSFGTNDLTQMTLGFSRDDAQGKFLNPYLEAGLLENDPFATLDTVGVGSLLERAVQGGLRSRPKLKLGVCGEHGGDPASIAYFHRLGLEYVSCSPYRVPVARLSAARAILEPRLRLTQST